MTRVPASTSTAARREPKAAGRSAPARGTRRRVAPIISELSAQIEALRANVTETQQALLKSWRGHLHDRAFLPSMTNLAAYIALRRHDLRSLQHNLGILGLSSLGRCEGHVVATLDAVMNALDNMCGKPVAAERIAAVSRAMAKDLPLLRSHTNRLLGPAPASRWTRFMVTLPSEAATDYEFVRRLLERGMDCARINCAHDSPEQWRHMAAHVQRAEADVGRPCRILMDLSGPKLRTGPVAPAAPVLRVKVKRDEFGRTLTPAVVILDGSGRAGQASAADRQGQAALGRLSVNPVWLNQLRPGDTVTFRDLRGRNREFKVAGHPGDNEVTVTCAGGAYIGLRTKFTHVPRGKRSAGGTTTTVTADFVPPPSDIRVQRGEMLLLTRKPLPGGPGRNGHKGKTRAPAHISCTEPGIFPYLKAGQSVWIDDGRVQARIERVDSRGAWLRITRARAGGSRIRAEKGLNFPDTQLGLPALSATSLEQLDVAVDHADIIGFSFVQSAADVDQLTAALAQRGGQRLGIIAKIETRAAVRNLPEIIIHGAGRHPFGVMIARGDLAVELGYERLAEIQEEIMWLCEAARVPVIWATQVLESLVKQGQPSRAEITDAAMSERAECVMLNKGPYVLEALAVLESVVTRMQHHQTKKTAQFRALHW